MSSRTHVSDASSPAAEPGPRHEPPHPIAALDISGPIPTMSRSQRLAASALFLAAGAVFLALAFRNNPLDEHEALVAETAREMVERNDWIVPRFATMPRIRKTPLAYWAVALLGRAAGRIDEAVARLPSAAAALGTIVCVFAIARRVFGPRVAVVAAFAALTSVGMMLFAGDGRVEMQLTFWCAACYLLFLQVLRTRRGPAGRWWAWAFYAALGVAMLAKAPMAGVFVGVPIAVFCGLMLGLRLWTLRDLKSLRVFAGVLLFLLVVLPWPLAVWQRVPQAAWQWRTEILDRFSGELDKGEQWGWLAPLYYAAALAGFAAPWTLAVPAAIAAPFLRRTADYREPSLLLASWLVVSVLILSAAESQRAHYVLPALPPLILLLAERLDHYFFRSARLSPDRARRIGRAALVVVGAASLAAFVVLRARDPAAVAPVLLAAGGATAAGLAALAAHVLGRRGISLALAGLCPAAGMIAWTAHHNDHGATRTAWRDLALRVARLAAPSDEVFWLGRPPATGIFYGGGRLVTPRLDDPGRLLKSTDGRFPPRMDWFIMVAGTAIRRLAEPTPVWLVMRDDAYAHLQRIRHNGRLTVVADIPDDDDWVVLTNRPADTRNAPAVGGRTGP